MAWEAPLLVRPTTTQVDITPPAGQRLVPGRRGDSGSLTAQHQSASSIAGTGFQSSKGKLLIQGHSVSSVEKDFLQASRARMAKQPA